MNIEDIDVFIFDFDGVLTNNFVYLNQKGDEFVSCSRSDGLAFDVLHKLGKKMYTLSTEKNMVVSARADKLRIPAVQGVDNKVDALRSIVEKNYYSYDNILYVGNDINDYYAMLLCGHTICPADSHNRIKEISNICLNTNGGCGVVRELIEDVFQVDMLKILYD